MKDEAHLTLLRSLPCAVGRWHHMANKFGLRGYRSQHEPPFAKDADPTCFGFVQAHHRTGAGLALKASDHAAFPLCVAHHRQFHDASGVFKGWSREQRNEWQDRMVELYKPDEEIF